MIHPLCSPLPRLPVACCDGEPWCAVRAEENDGHRTTYHLTPAGAALRPVLEAMVAWGRTFRAAGSGAPP